MCHGVINICEWGGVGGRETERERKRKNDPAGTSLVAQRLVIPHSQCRRPGDQGTRPHTPQLRVHMPKLKDPTCCNKD